MIELPCCNMWGLHSLPARWGLAEQLTFPDAGTEFCTNLPFVFMKPGKNRQAVLWSGPWAFPSTAGVSRTLGQCSPSEPPPLSLQVAMNILNSGRFSMGSIVAGMLKKLIGRYVGDRSLLWHNLAPAAPTPSRRLCHVLAAGRC